MTIELKHGTTLEGARAGRYTRYPLRAYDGFMGPLWLCGNEHGATMVIRAMSFSDAWEIMVDEMKPIDACEVPEAYGFASQDELDAAVADGEWPDLVEGYEYQSNVTGTGIVDVGHYAWLRELTREDFTDAYFNLRIDVRAA